MLLELIPAAEAEHDSLLRNLYQFYLYEFSRITTEWRVQADGRFSEAELDGCWNDAHRRIFLIRLDEAWVGFVIVDLNLPDPELQSVNELSEFFIMPPYRRKRSGEAVARQIFHQFKGFWELSVVETNQEARQFWRAVLAACTQNQFTETHRPEEQDFLYQFCIV